MCTNSFCYCVNIVIAMMIRSVEYIYMYMYVIVGFLAIRNDREKYEIDSLDNALELLGFMTGNCHIIKHILLSRM